MKKPVDKLHLGYVGLGKMGSNMVERLCERGYVVSAYDPDPAARARVINIANTTAYDSYTAMINSIEGSNKTIWIMVPSIVTTQVIKALAKLLSAGDLIIDGGNTNFNQTLQHHQLLTNEGLRFVDVGVSGGPTGARTGACMMVGADIDTFNEIKDLFINLCVPDGYGHVGPVGSGHFVKMIHNGIEYGMMQAIAEGFNLMHHSDFKLDLTRVAHVYGNGSVISSSLIDWLYQGYQRYGEELENVSGAVAHSGEGQWTVEYADQIGEPAEIIKGSLTFRKKSASNPSYTGRILSMLRNQFGGHDVGVTDDG
jgi:6-phosphogluconate dehydrogenase